jgi:hypothetical protein
MTTIVESVLIDVLFVHHLLFAKVALINIIYQDHLVCHAQDPVTHVLEMDIIVLSAGILIKLVLLLVLVKQDIMELLIAILVKLAVPLALQIQIVKAVFQMLIISPVQVA